MCTAAVGARDGLDDGEAEPGPAAASTVGCAAEGLERMLEERGRKAGAFVHDPQLQRVVDRDGAELGAAAAVAERVVDEIAERLLDQHAVE